MRHLSKLTALAILALAMVCVPAELSAQNRRGTNTSTSTNNSRSTAPGRSSGTSASRSAGTSTSRSAGTSASRSAGSTVTGPSGSTASRSAGTSASRSSSTSVSRSSGPATTRPSANTVQGSSTIRQDNNTGASGIVTPGQPTGVQQREVQDRTPSRVVRNNPNVSSAAGLTAAPEYDGGNRGASSGNRASKVNNYREDRPMKLDDGHNLHRVPPRERDFPRHANPAPFYGNDFHYFGYRVHSLPPRYRHLNFWGIDYWAYDNVYYRRYGNVYVICRPPFGVLIGSPLVEIAFAHVRFSYYNDIYRVRDILDENYRTILEQNRMIARNNALLASQNRDIALNPDKALSAQQLAEMLGLVQSFASASTEYFYQDGVFYTMERDGRYKVIVPPAGALVDELPDDYDVVVLGGVEYYKVDDTVYRLTLVDGIPVLEVLGQFYGDMARRYDYNYR